MNYQATTKHAHTITNIPYPVYTRLMSGSEKKKVMLISQARERYLVNVGQGTIKVSRLGVVDTDRLVDTVPGQRVEIAGETYTVIESDLSDHLNGLNRGAQIITPKDGAQIIVECGIVSGHNVLEIGAGSGSLTMMLAGAVMPGGKITSYEREPKSARVVRKNLETSGLAQYVELREEDANNCQDENMYDVVTTDMPEPWKIMDVIERAMKPGGHYCAYVPSMNQVEATVKCLRKRNFFDIRAQETLLRNIVVGEKGTRPDYQMLGHTGYLCFARYLG